MDPKWTPDGSKIVLTTWFMNVPQGTMPSHDLLLHFQKELKLEKRWTVNGKHYAKTLDAWLYKMDNCYDEIWPILRETYGNFSMRG